jgi:hypothetical protein
MHGSRAQNSKESQGGKYMLTLLLVQYAKSSLRRCIFVLPVPLAVDTLSPLLLTLNHVFKTPSYALFSNLVCLGLSGACIVVSCVFGGRVVVLYCSSDLYILLQFWT